MQVVIQQLNPPDPEWDTLYVATSEAKNDIGLAREQVKSLEDSWSGKLGYDLLAMGKILTGNNDLVAPVFRILVDGEVLV